MLDGTDEPDRLRALLTLMREFGMTKVVTPDGFHLERPPLSPIEAAVAREASERATAAASTPDDDEVEEEERREASLREQWDSHWVRLTLASGAPIPSFPGADKALRILGRFA